MLKLLLKINGYPLKEAKSQFDIIQNELLKSPEEWHEKAKWKIYLEHFNNTPHYRNVICKHKAKQWNEIPIAKKHHFQYPLKEIINKNFQLKNLHLSSTSGSSGHPLFFAKDKMAHAMTYALIDDRYKWHDLDLNMFQARFYGMPNKGWSFWSEKTKDVLFNRRRFTVSALTDERLNDWARIFKNNSFEYLYGYTSVILLFASFLNRNNIDLRDYSPKLKAVIVTSEMCSREDKLFIEKVLNLPVINEYGASELDVIAFTDKNEEWVISDENIFVEVVDENGDNLKDGEEGRLLITSLHNRAMPFIRYDLGDMGVISRNKKNLLIKLSGRTSDFAILPSGKKVAGMTFYYLSRRILEETGLLKEFIVRQTHIDTFEFDVVPFRKLNRNEIDELKKTIYSFLESDLKLIINQMEQIKRPQSGEIKHFYSEIKT